MELKGLGDHQRNDVSAIWNAASAMWEV